jgi:UDP-N-acetylmuramate--alanine ligase
MDNIERMRNRIKNIHFIGIGGAGMGGIAEILQQEGYQVSGSDKQTSAMTDRLLSLGIRVNIGHTEAQVAEADVVVVSSAIHDDNPEIKAAKSRGIPIVQRALMLAELMRFRYGIAVAGTHGKTTTTSLTASLLTEGGYDPAYVIGGKLNSSGTNAYMGKSRYLVVEADESDASFLHLQPMMTIVTNIDADHMSTYGGDFNRLKETFIEFIHHLPFYGLAVLCHDDPVIQSIRTQIARPVLTYGFHPDADIKASEWRQEGLSCSFMVTHKAANQCYPVHLNLAGEHNVSNALAAIAIAAELGVSVTAIQKACAEFKGVGRRMQSHGVVRIGQANAALYDDYGHHPREVFVTLTAIRAAFPTKRLVTVFQPHRYSRTHDLFQEFVDALQHTDVLVLLDVYSAGETPIQGADSEHLARAIHERHDLPVIHVRDHAALAQTLETCLKQDDLLLLQGAGDVGALAVQLEKTYGLPDQ